MPPKASGESAQGSTIAVLGLGFVGLPLGATFAELGFSVTGIDVSPRILSQLENRKAPFEEAGLQELLHTVLGKNLSVASAMAPKAHNVYIVAVGTPIDDVTGEPKMEYVQNAAAMIGAALKKGDLVIMRSTVPVGTTREVVLPILERESGLKTGADFDLVFAPERLVAGKALAELRELPQIIGGFVGTGDIERAGTLFRSMTPNIVIAENLEAAELGKLIDNTYRDLHFAYANQMAMLAEKIGVDLTRLVHDVNNGYKRNRIPVPSPGVGGICLKKDPGLLIATGKKYGYHPSLTETARLLNAKMPEHVAARIIELLRKAGKSSKGAHIFILGFAFKGKPVTSDTRDAPTAGVVQALQKEGCSISGYDPVVSKEHFQSLSVAPLSIEEGFKMADAVVIMTNHPEFETLPIDALLASMKKPACFFDGWHLFDPEKMRKIEGIVYAGVGNN